MSIVVLGIDSFLSYNSFSLTIRLVIDIVTGLFVYLIMAVITKNKNLLYFVNVIKIFIGK